ncbi:radial spoke head protein 9 homolog isoform X2 [Epinephelus fuscoguttatus]|uniref:radial spoke head protein 9 homolog isoform X2 n=1 Tax=Epinephelus fuscoguttatus TaxID=293821 RepID=UPI0020D1172E|nr:radial spoke head protein 9 homolog isoform X2 [Epinephelus fuscoguttatus]
MDSDSLYYSLELVGGSGNNLNVEQRTALQTSLVLLKKNYKFHRVLFWGKILGLKEDYFIAQGRGEDEMQDRKNLYSFNCMDWFLLPPATDSMMEEVSKAAKGRFRGDPSHVYEHRDILRQGEKDEEEVVTKVNEESRLAVTVHHIDDEVSVVPRGAFIRSPHGLVQINRSFGGLSHSEAGKLDNFLHFSQAKNPKKKSILEMGDLNPAVDFLDVLSDDIPKGSWSLQFEYASKVCVLRSLLWLGLTFYHVPMMPQHGYVYIGDGTKNLDLPFMI